MKHLLILYTSSEGQTDKIAHKMAETARAADLEVTVADLTDDATADSLDAADAVIIGASVHAGTHQKEAVDFAKEHRSRLEEIPSGFFSVSMAKAGGDPADEAEAKQYIDRFLEQTGWRPDHTATFAGALKYRQYGLIKRYMMKMISKSKGGETDTSRDYEYTDWEAVDRFTREFAAVLN